MEVGLRRKTTTVLVCRLKLPYILYRRPDAHYPALNHHTSKLTTLSSLTTLTSFGFRGEALSSLCALCESVAVITATEDQKGVGCKLEMGEERRCCKKRGCR